MTMLSLDEKSIKMRMRQMGKPNVTFKVILEEFRKANGWTQEELEDRILRVFANPLATTVPPIHEIFPQPKH